MDSVYSVYVLMIIFFFFVLDVIFDKKITFEHFVKNVALFIKLS